MLLVLEVQQCPQVAIAAKDDMSSSSAVAAIGSAFGHIFRTVEVHATWSAFARAAVDLYIIDKRGRCHVLFLYDVEDVVDLAEGVLHRVVAIDSKVVMTMEVVCANRLGLCLIY